MDTKRETPDLTHGLRRSRRHHRRALGATAVVVLAAATLLTAQPAATSAPAAPAKATGPSSSAAGAPRAAAADCTVTAKLVNPCRPWLGTVATGYPGLGNGLRQQTAGHEARIGRQVDVVHWYHQAGQVALSADERYYATRPETILYLNWNPSNNWGSAGGGNATVNSQIDTMADQIKSLGSAKIMLAVFGEPERHATAGTSACPGLHGNAGSPAQYKQMWANVQTRFAARGVSNVVWVMNYLGYFGWDCFFPELWPGNDRVDWIVWDPYIGPNQTWDNYTGYFYRAMEQKADATHDYLSKPWGLAEYAYWFGTADQTHAYRMYADAHAWITSGLYPRLKLYEIYDVVTQGLDMRTSYKGNGVADPVEQQMYNAIANDPIFTDDAEPPPPPPPTTNHLASCDVSVEASLSCVSGTYDGTIFPTRQTADGQHGTSSAQVTNTTGSTRTIGVNIKPVPVSSTQVGRTYTGSVWVKASAVGMTVNLLLRERRPANGTAPPNGYRQVSWTATDTSWHQLSGSYTAQEANNTITMSVFASTPASQWVRSDSYTLTSPNP